MKNIFCEAIQRRALLEFQYQGYLRIVQPYCFGVSMRDNPVLRAVQVRGASASNQFGTGKLWSVDEICEARILEEAFTPDDPTYNPKDTAMKRIYCRIARD